MLIVNKGIAQPWECDVMGHLTTRFYVALFDDASYHLLYEAFGWTISAHESRKFGWADVRHVIEYKAEVSAGDILEVRAYLRKIGTKSITVLYEMINVASDEVVATLEAVCVYFDLEKRCATPLTEKMKQRSLQYLES
jgi:acyl-CoA thioester hydrolase